MRKIKPETAQLNYFEISSGLNGVILKTKLAGLTKPVQPIQTLQDGPLATLMAAATSAACAGVEGGSRLAEVPAASSQVDI